GGREGSVEDAQDAARVSGLPSNRGAIGTLGYGGLPVLARGCRSDGLLAFGAERHSPGGRNENDAPANSDRHAIRLCLTARRRGDRRFVVAQGGSRTGR